MYQHLHPAGKEKKLTFFQCVYDLSLQLITDGEIFLTRGIRPRNAMQKIFSGDFFGILIVFEQKALCTK